MNDFDKLVSTSELADILGVHFTTVEKYVRDNKIPHYRLDKGNRFNVKDVLESLRYKGDDNE
jgi:excisionase family DNA binding protein